MSLARSARSVRGRITAGLGLVFVALTAPFAAAPAYAASSSIDHVQADKTGLQVVLSLTGVPNGVSPDLGTVTATFNGKPVTAKAQELSGSGSQTIRRTTVLALDVSASMKGKKFDEAKSAAQVFLDNVPSDVNVGLVTFADKVTEVQAPTQDRNAVRDALNNLQLSKQTHLYDGVSQALTVAGKDGSRSVLVLSDGRDTSGSPLTDLAKSVKKSGVKVDVVALAQRKKDEALLAQVANAGHGRVLSAGDPTALSQVFAAEAKELAHQLLVTVTPSADMQGKEGTLSVTVQVDNAPATDEAFVALPSSKQATPGEADTQTVPVKAGFTVPRDWMFGGLAAAAVAVVFIMFLAFGGPPTPKQDAIDRSIEAYTRKGARRLAEANKKGNEAATVTQQAVAVAENVLEGQKGLEDALGSRLEAAGMALKPAEWLLIHMGVVVGFGIFALLIGGGSVLWMLLGLALGAALPWLFLKFRRKRRLSAFKAQLADTLQLMAGSLSAGLSLAQSVDAVVREGADPMAAEFRRALVESRLGVEIEDALQGIAERMHSVDFEWIVMAIRIQRDVGGNLAELLNKVAETIREREYLERQVKTLSAEGRLSVWILGGLPPGFLCYLLIANPSYVSPMFHNPLGYVMLTVMAVLLTGGIFWMKRLVRVEV